MAELRIINLPYNTNPSSSDILPVIKVSDGSTTKVTIANAVASLSSLPLQAANYVYVPITNNAVTNGNNLIAAYTSAKTLTPNGSSLSSTNRVSIIVPPGKYDLGTSFLTLDTEYIDLIGLTKEASHVIITSASIGQTINQTANDVRCIGFTVKNTSAFEAYAFSSNLNLAYCENIIFGSIYAGVLSGTFKNCTSTTLNYPNGAYCAYGGSAAGKFINCNGINSQLLSGGFAGISGTAPGIFINCTGSNTGGNGGGFVGNAGDASGTFTNCKGFHTGSNLGAGGFTGYGGYASGIFINCIGKSEANNFGGGFAGRYGYASGTFINCTGTNTGGNGGGFVGTAGIASGTFTNCIGKNTGYAGGGFVGASGSASGTFTNSLGIDETSGGGGIGGYTSIIKGRFINCKLLYDTNFPTLTNSGDSTKPACYINCLDNSGKLVNGSA